MAWTITCRRLVGIFTLWMIFAGTVWAQTITVSQNVLPATSLCSGAGVTLSFATSGTFAAGNTFSLQRSEADGTFPAAPVSLGTLVAAPASATTLTISGTLGATPFGAGYRFRVVSSNPAHSSGQTPAAVTIGTSQPGGAATFTTCQNSGNYALTASGTSLEWYSSPAATTPAGTGDSFAVPTTSAGTYYVTQTSNGCKSDKKAIALTLTAPPSTTPVISGLRAYCPGAGGQLTASGTGTSFRWVNLNDNTEQRAATINAPSVSTRYRVSQFSGSCEGPQGEVSITVYATPAKPTLASAALAYCQGATPATLSVTNLDPNHTVLWTFPGNRQETSNLVSATEAGQYSVVQRSPEGCFSAPATASITINSKPSPPTLNSAGPFCQFSGTSNTQVITANGQEVKWYADAATATVAATGASFSVSTATTNPRPVVYLEQTINGCTSNRAALPVQINPTPAAPALSAVTYPTNYCASDAGSAPALTLAGGGTSVRWYNLTDNSASTAASLPAPNATKQYQVSQSIGECESPRSAAFTVTVKSNPGIPSLTGNTTFCQNTGAQTITAAGDGGATIEWFTSQTAANVASTGNSFTISTTSASPGPVVYLQQRVDGCASARIARPITVNATPGKPSISGTYAACQNAQAEPLSSAASGQGLRWYEGQTERAGTYRPGTSTVGTSASFVVTQTINGCEGPAETLTLTVYGLPAKPTLNAYNYCSAQAPATLAAGGTNIRWYTSAGGFLASGNTYPAPAATTTYRVTQTDGRNCQSDFETVTVQVRPTPGAPALPNPSPIFCQTRAAQPLSAMGENLIWSDAAGTVLAGAPTPVTNNTGIQRYFVTQTNSANCTSTTAVVTVTVNPIPAQPAVITPRPYCSGETADVLAASGNDLRWYDPNTGGLGSPNAPRPATTPNPDGATTTRTYYVTQIVGACESERRDIAVTIKRKPGLPANVPGNPEFCQTTTGQAYPAPVLTAVPEPNARLIWVADGRESETAPVTPGDRATTYTYAVAQTLNGCRSDNAWFTVRVKPTPLQPGIVPFTLCQGRESQPLQVQGERLRYYDASNSLLGSSTPSPSTSQVTTVIYRVTQTNGEGCESAKIDYAVPVYAVPAPPAVKDLQYCLLQQDQPAQDIKPLTAEGANLRWYFSDNNMFAPGTSPNPQPDNLRTERYMVTQTVNNCQSNQAAVTVRVVTTPTPVLSTSLLTYCRNDISKPIDFTAAAGSTLTWIDPNGVASSQTPTPPTLNATKGGERYQVYALGSNGCYSARASVGLVVNTNPTLSLFGSTTINYGQTTDLTLRFTSRAPYSFTLSDGTSGTAPDSVFRQSVKPLQTTIYQVTSVSNVCGVGLAGNPATTTVFVRIPTITTLALTGSTSLCAGTSLAVAYTTTGTFNQGNRFKVQLADSTAKVYTDVSPETTANPIPITIPASLKGGPYFVRVLATNPGAEVPGERSPTFLTVKGLPSATLSGTQNIYETYPASLTLTLAGHSPWTVSYAGSDGQTGTLTPTSSPYILTVQPAKTTTYQLTSILNECSTSGTVSGSAVVTVLPLLATEDPLSGALSVHPVPTQHMLTVAIDLPLQQPAVLALSDLMGRPVWTRTTHTRQTQLDLSQQPAGVYLLSVQVGDKRVVRKVLKQ